MGMPRPIFVSMEDFEPTDRTYLVPQQEQYALSMLPEDSSLKTILYHERDPTNYGLNKTFVTMTCGKCHEEQVKDFLATPMGNVTYQSAYPTFTDPPGPHNCGYWLVDMEKIASEVSTEYTKEQAQVVDRICQQCHTGCLDCHYQPFEGKGTHFFSKTVPTTSCETGGGRGICHAGAEDFRRGAGYNRDLTSIPVLPKDAHAAQNMTCTDCHEKEGHYFERSVTNCHQCHQEAVEKMEGSVHQNMSCEACHIKALGGYQMTFWSPGEYYDVVSPLVKNNYYGSLSNPILIKDPEGIWIPVKALPQAVLNMKGEVAPTGVEYRSIPTLRNTSRDAYGIAGTFKDLPENNNALLWVHMDKASHALGPARECSECHETGIQEADSTWISFGEHVYPPLNQSFRGEHRIIGNSTGLYVTDIRTTSPISTNDLGHASDFLPWAFGFKWVVDGDFTLPVKDRGACEEARDCIECHGEGHAIVTPVYLTQRPLLVYAFMAGAILLITLLYYVVGMRK